MALRMSPTSKRDKERLRQIQHRREEQDRIIRIIKGIRGDKEVICQSTQVRIKWIYINYFTTAGCLRIRCLTLIVILKLVSKSLHLLRISKSLIPASG